MKILRSLYFGMYSLFNQIWMSVNKVHHQGLKVDGFLYVYNKGEIRFGTGGKINSHALKNIIGGDTRSSLIVKKGARFVAGDNFKMSNSAIYCAESIEIGDNVMIGGSCRIWDSDFHPLNPEQRALNPNESYTTRPVQIGANVFIGGGTIILKGTSIGEGAIIGAGSVVSGQVPSREIWAGNPAKFVKNV